jgi:hypothetical protein
MAPPLDDEEGELLAAVALAGSPGLASYAEQLAFAAMGQSSAVHMACSCGPWDWITVAAAEHLPSNVVVNSLPTAVASSVVTPKEVAERPTCWMKYPTSLASRSINLAKEVQVQHPMLWGEERETFTYEPYTWMVRQHMLENRSCRMWNNLGQHRSNCTSG